jgi:hypothetical protein
MSVRSDHRITRSPGTPARAVFARDGVEVTAITRFFEI